MKIFQVVVTLIGSLAFSASVAFAGGGTALTYQGRLLDAGEPANGLFNVEFSLWDDPTAGNQIGATVMLNSLPISDGLFTAELDFGANAFNNTDRWLEIVVDGVPLAPRQPITRSPYSIQTRGIFVDQDQRVFVGRDSPITPSEVFGIHSDTNSFGGMYVSTSSEQGLPFYGYSASGGVDAYHSYNGATGNWQLYNDGFHITVQPDGNVGIGTTAPEYALHVESDGFRAINVVDTANAGATFGVWSESTNTNGTGVRGFASAIFGGTFGVRGRANSSDFKLL